MVESLSDKDSESQSTTQISKIDIVEQELLHSYSLRPKISQKFRASDVKELLHSVLLNHLADKDYNVDTCTELSRAISTEIKEKLKTLNYDRYKFVVQCVIGEQKGAGVNMTGRCFWDSDTDNFAESIYMNKTLFCAVSAYGVYYY
jgi:tctex1 domain-containing protein 2